MAEATRIKVVSTHHDFSGFDYLAALHAEADDPEVGRISLEMGGVTWFSAIMTAPLKVLTDRWERDGKPVTIGSDPFPKVYDALCRNRFLCFFGRSPVADGFNTSIPVTLFPDEQDKRGAEFLRTEVMASPHLPSRMTARRRRDLMTNFGEAFVNVRHHADTNNVAACGQYYDRKKRLGIVVADGGVTIPSKVNRHVGIKLSPVDAVRWALEQGNTTRGDRMGGDGLWTLRNFVIKHGGSLTVVSGSVHWSQEGKQESGRLLRSPFPGTCIYWEIEVDNEKDYEWEEE